MGFFAVLKKKLTRREKKGKPVPVPVVPAEKPIKAVTYNRCDGHVSGGLIQAGAVWDEEARVYKGTNYFVQAQEVDRIMREAELKARKKLPVRYDEYGGDDFAFYADSTTFDEAFFHQSEETRPERGYSDTKSASGYDYTPEPVSPAYVAPSPSYEAPTYSSHSYSSDSGSSSSSYSDSGSSSCGSGGGGE